MAIYLSASAYLATAKSMEDKIKKIDEIIDALLLTAESAAGKDEISEYQLTDSQSTIRTTYRGVASIQKSIENFERLRQLYMNRLTGRVIRLSDSKNFRGGISNGR